MVMNHDTAGPRREAILNAAERAFNVHGYAGTTMDEVAAEAGVSKGSIYNYFQNKDDLFRQVFLAVLGVAEVDLEKILSEPLTAPEKLNSAFDYWYDRVSRFLVIGRVVIECWATVAGRPEQDELAQTQNVMYRTVCDLVGRILVQGVREGHYRPDLVPQTSALLIVAMLDGLMLQAIMGVGVRSIDRTFLEELKRTVNASIARPAPADDAEQKAV